jgi:hypothetical protein
MHSAATNMKVWRLPLRCSGAGVATSFCLHSFNELVALHFLGFQEVR